MYFKETCLYIVRLFYQTIRNSLCMSRLRKVNKSTFQQSYQYTVLLKPIYAVRYKTLSKSKIIP